MCYYADIPGFELYLPLLLYLKGHTRHLKFMRSCSNYFVGAIEYSDETEFCCIRVFKSTSIVSRPQYYAKPTLKMNI